MDKIEELLKNQQTDLQKQALTDTSYKNIDHSLSDDDTNFELATYGDAILKLALCKIYRRDKKHGMQFPENLSDWKKKYESDEVLVRVVAKHYNLLGFFRYDEKGNGKPKEQKPIDYKYEGKNAKRRYKYIATAMEACIAAVYIESTENGENGGKEVRKIVEKWIQWIDEAANFPDKETV